MGAFLALSRAIDGMTTWVGRIVAWAIFAAVIVSTGNAIVRKLFDQSSNSWLELQWYLFGAVFMLCSAWTLLANEHIRIDIVNNLLPVRTRNWIDVIGHVLFLLPLTVLMVWTCTPFVLKSFQANEQSLNAGGLIVWPAKAIILVGFAMLLLQGISELIKRVAIMRGELEDVHGGGHHAMAEAEAQRLLEQAKAAGLALELDGQKS
ncbi:MAG: C4-dicarboxylate ABC transporter [Candidatus Raskinella chloraquaticus]|uniref:TRAP transporter small permease protein n=2 Tax=Candidatus Raskinella chloraquaticus TaxID=1951219 RepID=A0A1W9HVU9_9HYPH|nr:MAG: C4-dicarboxylate ABC transporter [Proteobacteria bacterium SG_bin8]